MLSSDFKHMPPITIAGAGIAGLTLGKCLAHKGVPSLLLERYNSSPRYNYGITLHPWAYRPLLQVLQMDESTFRETLSIDTLHGGIGRITGDNMPTGLETSPGTFRCHRGRLERLLREDQNIRWEYNIQNVTTSHQNVEIHIVDEKPVETRVLIGTDGVHSQVRKSLAPDIQLKVLPYVVFNGTRTMSLKEYQEILAPQMQGNVIIGSRYKDVVLQIAVNDFAGSIVFLGYTYSRPARYPKDPLHRPDRSIPGTTDIPEEFYIEVEGLEGIGQAFAEIFNVEKVRKDRILHWLMRSTLGSLEDSQKLTDRGVLLVGDAIHAMPILGGEGANAAMKDGFELAEHLAANGPDGIRTFSSARHDLWKEGVEGSELRLSEMHVPAKASL